MGTEHAAATAALVNALPYVDRGFEEAGVREAALSMVEEEMRRYRPTKNYLEQLPPLNLKRFETDLLRAEFERLSNRQPPEHMSMKRYELPPPPPGRLTDVQSWRDAVDNSKAQLEHQSVRILNLQLLLAHGPDAWRCHNEQLAKSLADTERRLQATRRVIQEVNLQRKTEQLRAGERLHSLEDTWVHLVMKNYELEREIADLEAAVMAAEAEQPPPPEPSSAASGQQAPPPAEAADTMHADEQAADGDDDEDAGDGDSAGHEDHQLPPTPPHLTPDAATPPHLSSDAATPPHLSSDAATPPRLTSDAATPPHLTSDAATPPHLSSDAATPPHLTSDAATPPGNNSDNNSNSNNSDNNSNSNNSDNNSSSSSSSSSSDGSSSGANSPPAVEQPAD